METTARSNAATSTGSASPRASSASRREASEMSLISRSSRRTSCCMIDSRRSREDADLTRGKVSTALRREVRGFSEFMCDIGGEALDRLDAAVERMGHLAERAREMADFVGSIGEVGDLLARSYASLNAFGRLGELTQGFGDRIGLRDRENEHHGRRDQEVSQERPTFAGDHLVDVAALSSTGPGRLGSRSSAESAPRRKRWFPRPN